MTGPAWTVVVHHDGQPITGQLPLNAWETAGLLAPLAAGLTRRTVTRHCARCGYSLAHLTTEVTPVTDRSNP